MIQTENEPNANDLNLENNNNIQMPNHMNTEPIPHNDNFQEFQEFLRNGEEDDLNSSNFENNIDDIYNNISSMINNEKAKLQKERENIAKTKKEFNEYKAQEITKLEKEKVLLKESLKLGQNEKESDIIDLNIGGTHEITTTRSTLAKYKNSALGLLFSGQLNLSKRQGKVFIDREGPPFINLVNFLRSGKFPLVQSKEEEAKFYDELDFWKIPIFEGSKFYNNISIENITNEFQFDPDWCAKGLNLERNNTKVRKQNPQHGVVFCKQPLDIYYSYIEFKVSVINYWKGKSYLFLGLVDKSKYKFENMLSKPWKDSPSAYYWDIMNKQLVKTNETGAQIGCAKGYGCQCNDFDCNLGIKYDYRTRSVSFYKNGINLGVAFRNVPGGLTPTLDIWFEQGSVDIVKNASCQEKTFL